MTLEIIKKNGFGNRDYDNQSFMSALTINLNQEDAVNLWETYKSTPLDLPTFLQEMTQSYNQDIQFMIVNFLVKKIIKDEKNYVYTDAIRKFIKVYNHSYYWVYCPSILRQKMGDKSGMYLYKPLERFTEIIESLTANHRLNVPRTTCGTDSSRLLEDDLLASVLFCDIPSTDGDWELGYSSLLEKTPKLEHIQSNIEKMVNKWKDLEPEKISDYKRIYNLIRETKEDPEEFDKQKNNIIARFEDLIKYIQEIKTKMIKEAPVSEGILAECVQDIIPIFTEKNKFPYNLFGKIEFVEEDFESTVEQYTIQRESCVHVPYHQTTTYDSSIYYINNIRDILVSQSINKIIEQEERLEIIEIKDQEHYFSELTKHIEAFKEQGLSPIIISNNWWYEYNTPNGINITYAKANDIQFVLNDTPVYHHNDMLKDTTFIMPKEILKLVKFQQQTNGEAIQVTHKEHKRDELKIDLTFEWGQEIVLDTNYKIYKLIHEQIDEKD